MHVKLRASSARPGLTDRPTDACRGDNVLGASAASSRQVIKALCNESGSLLVYCPGQHIVAVDMATAGEWPWPWEPVALRGGQGANERPALALHDSLS